MAAAERQLAMAANDDEQIDTLDIGTINAERREYLTTAIPEKQDDTSSFRSSQSKTSASSASTSENTDCPGKRYLKKKERAKLPQIGYPQVNTAPSSGSCDEPPTANNTPNNNNCAPSKRRSSLLSLNFFRRSSQKDGSVQEDHIGIDKIKDVTISSLPQGFVTKYLGVAPCKGLYGIEVVREPIDYLINKVADFSKDDDLPLVQCNVFDKGLYITAHPKNRGTNLSPFMFPIEYISYGVQDVRFCRVVGFIVVKELCRSQNKTECHAFVCSDPVQARRLALSMAFAFKSISRSTSEKKIFSVDIRTPDEIASQITNTRDKTEADV